MDNENSNQSLDDTSKFYVSGNQDDRRDPVIIKAIGVGGGGNNAVDHMYREGIECVSFVNINTDKMTLKHSAVPNRLQIGPGLGAGNKPEVAEQYAEDDVEAINALFDDETKMVFITAGMGGGTGTGAAPVVARVAKERGLLTIGIVTIPFLFEGKKKIMKALAGADKMKQYVDALLVINNERLTEIYPDCNMIDGFAKADDTLLTAARSISELITKKGHIDVDFADVDTTLREGGSAIISTGYGEGERRVTKAIEDALNSPLLKNRDIMGSKKLLFNLYFSREADDKFLMEEANELTEFVTNIDPGVDVIWGLSFDESLGNKVKITILAAGFDVALDVEEEELETRKKPSGPFGGFVARPKPRVEPRKEPPTDADQSERLAQEYGADKIGGMHKGKGNIILSPDQFDDDEVIELIERNPTYSRDKKIVDRARNLNGSSIHRNPRNDRDDRGTIDF
nr:cell division protein FtsZ [Bacteroides sp.]